MIITKKQFPNYRKFEMTYEGRPLTMEVGKLAELCNAAVLVTYGETTVLVTCTASARPKDGIDYFPLAVDFNEKLYAVGRIPGSFMRREGKPSLQAVLASRPSASPTFPSTGPSPGSSSAGTVRSTSSTRHRKSASATA